MKKKDSKPKHDTLRVVTRDLIFRTAPQEKLGGIKRTAGQIESRKK